MTPELHAVPFPSLQFSQVSSLRLQLFDNSPGPFHFTRWHYWCVLPLGYFMVGPQSGGSSFWPPNTLCGAFSLCTDLWGGDNFKGPWKAQHSWLDKTNLTTSEWIKEVILHTHTSRCKHTLIWHKMTQSLNLTSVQLFYLVHFCLKLLWLKKKKFTRTLFVWLSMTPGSLCTHTHTIQTHTHLLFHIYVLSFSWWRTTKWNFTGFTSGSPYT